MQCNNGRFVSNQFPVTFLIQWSYQLIPSRIVGLPDWTSEWAFGYDIEAKAAQPVSQNDCREMVQQLLADRFQLRSHNEQRKMHVYLLTTTDDGKKLREMTEANSESGARMNGQLVGDLADNKGLSMPRLAELLGAHPSVGIPVIDKTGLNGRFNFSISFSMRDDDEHPPIFTVLRDVGLKLERMIAPVEILVVDHIEKGDRN